MVVSTIGVGDPNASGDDRVDLAVLQTVAQSTGGHFFRAEDGAQLEEIYADIDKLAPTTLKVQSWRPRLPLFHWPLAAAVLLTLAAWLVLLAGNGWKRRNSLRHV